MQRGSSGVELGGSMAESMAESRRRSLRPSRSEVIGGHHSYAGDDEVFKPPRIALQHSESANHCAVGDPFKMPASRRDSTSSVASKMSTASSSSRLQLPLGAGRFFTCDDEDGEQFSSSYLNEMKEGEFFIKIYQFFF